MSRDECVAVGLGCASVVVAAFVALCLYVLALGLADAVQYRVRDRRRGP